MGVPYCCRTVLALVSRHQVRQTYRSSAQMIRWNVLIQRELIEQRSLFDLPVAHHDLQSRLVQRLNQRTSCVATAAWRPSHTSTVRAVAVTMATFGYCPSSAWNERRGLIDRNAFYALTSRGRSAHPNVAKDFAAFSSRHKKSP
jgi:hypothetical protein